MDAFRGSHRIRWSTSTTFTLFVAWLVSPPAARGQPYDVCQTATGSCWDAHTAHCVGGTNDGTWCDPGTPPTLSPCVIGGGSCPGVPGCDDAQCCDSVCAIDEFCCDQHWDSVCVTEAPYYCTPPVPENDECYSMAPEGGARELVVPSHNGLRTLGATQSAAEPPLCCESNPRHPEHPNTVWFWFVAPPAESGETTSSVGLSTCIYRYDKILETLLQVHSVEEPDAGLCADGVTRCSVDAQDCGEGRGPCEFDEARACSSLTPIGCNDYIPFDGPFFCPATGVSALCVEGLVPGDRYYGLLAMPDDPSSGASPLDLWSPCGFARPTLDCNGNGLSDDCDVAAGQPDVNGNVVPDECELLGYCDRDNVVDRYDAARFAVCMTGPGPILYSLSIECRCLELTGDRRVDLNDVADFCRRFGDTR